MYNLYFLPACESLYLGDLIGDKLFDDFNATIQVQNILKSHLMALIKREIETTVKEDDYRNLFGLFLLCNEKEILSIATVYGPKLSILFTLPQHRNNGYAGQLLDKITEFGLRNSVHYISPIEEKLVMLFTKHNWIRIGDIVNKDYTCDYCHKIFYKNKILTYPNTQFKSTPIISQAFMNIRLPDKYIYAGLKADNNIYIE